jgi:protein TonB
VRIYTLVLSIVVHVVAIGALIVVPLLATGELPEPRRSVEFYDLQPVTIQPPPQLAPRRTETPQPSPTAAPIDVPVGVEPEPVDAAPPPSELSALIEGPPMLGEIVEVAPPPPPPVAPTEPIRPGGAISRPERTHYVAPDYPPLARAARVEGTVILEAVLDAEGNVRQARVLRSVPLLDASALDAVRQWRFTPTRLNGIPVPVVMTVTVVFSLR